MQDAAADKTLDVATDKAHDEDADIEVEGDGDGQGNIMNL